MDPPVAVAETPNPAPTELHRTLVENTLDMIVALDEDGAITYANEASHTELGYRPGALLGHPALDLIHPDDVARAADDMAATAVHGAPRGTAGFRLRRADGSWLTTDVTSANVHDGEQRLMAVVARPATDRAATDEIVLRLLHGATRAEVLVPVCDLFAWQVNGTRVGVSWSDGTGWGAVSAGLPDVLVGADGLLIGPWARSRAEGAACIGDAADLEGPAAAVAADLGLATYWIVPVPDTDGRPPALITVWGEPDARPSQAHAYGMLQAQTFVELILRWTHQVAQLDVAAHTDALTGAPNRKAFLDRLAEDAVPGALLYCDLDAFKPVNDAFGHAAGDAVLCQVVERLRGAVRAEDLVARIGGDEFVVLCPGATEDDAIGLAGRIQRAFSAPFHLGLRTASVGISIGIGVAPRRLTIHTLDAADRDLFAAKARGGTSLRHREVTATSVRRHSRSS